MPPCETTCVCTECVGVYADGSAPKIIVFGYMLFVVRECSCSVMIE